MFAFGFGTWTGDVSAKTKEISELAIGSVISVNSVRFVKIDTEGNFIAVQEFTKSGFANDMYMQDFTATMCNNAPTPVGTDYFLIGTLKDKRDNKQYEVRKFADGKCWMVDNLAYGGDTASGGSDGCMKTTWGAASNTGVTPTNRFGVGTYGDCRYPYASTSTPDTAGWGYMYNWQAVMQNAQAHANNVYQPVQPTQGICPSGWHVPSGGDGGEFMALHVAAGSPQAGFWQMGDAWQSATAGRAVPGTDDLQHQRGAGMYWSSTQYDGGFTYNISIGQAFAQLVIQYGKNNGLAVRCVKDTQEPILFGCNNPTDTMQTWHGCSTLTTPTGTNFTQGPCLMDERNGKTYQVRKFADGKCWMATNLAYGGEDRDHGDDNCMKTEVCGYGYHPDGACITDPANAVSVVDKIAPGLYGDCRYPYTAITDQDSNKYGYMYTWQAAVQDADAYLNTDKQPRQPTQGICPDGWYLPTGGDNGQFQALHLAAGMPETGFWQSGASWDATYAGRGYNVTALQHRGTNGMYWSSTAYDRQNINILMTSNTRAIFPQYAKANALTIRCVQE